MKKLLSAAIAVCTAVMSVSALNSSALFQVSYDDKEISSWTNGYKEVDEKYYPLCGSLMDCAPEDMALYYNNEGNRSIILKKRDMRRCYVTLSENVTISQVNSKLSEYFASYKDDLSINGEYIVPQITVSGSDAEGNKLLYICNIKNGGEKAVVNFLRDEEYITDSYIRTKFIQKQIVDADYPLLYNVCHEDDAWERSNEAECMDIINYVSDSAIGEVLYYSDFFAEGELTDSFENCGSFRIVLPEDLTLEDILDVALAIYEKTGMIPVGMSPVINSNFEAGNIDAFNYINGDANNDGELGIADATCILQSIGNPDKYKLSPQGEYNADVDGSGGITAKDALEVQNICFISK